MDVSTTGLAPVIPLHLHGVRSRPASCFICKHASYDEDGVTTCTVVDEVIHTENLTALECDTYDEDEAAT